MMERARRHDDAAKNGKDDGETFTQDEFTVLNFGFRNHQERDEADRRRERRQKASEAQVDGSRTATTEAREKECAAKDTIAAAADAQEAKIAPAIPRLEKQEKSEAIEPKNKDGIEAARARLAARHPGTR
jgi:hypothetical protein